MLARLRTVARIKTDKEVQRVHQSTTLGHAPLLHRDRPARPLHPRKPIRPRCPRPPSPLRHLATTNPPRVAQRHPILLRARLPLPLLRPARSQPQHEQNHSVASTVRRLQTGVVHPQTLGLLLAPELPAPLRRPHQVHRRAPRDSQRQLRVSLPAAIYLILSVGADPPHRLAEHAVHS